MHYDAVVIGAGFGGLYALKVLRDKFNMSVRVFEKAPDVGGTWYWNRYPGCLSDIEAFTYCYSWDKELLQEMPLTNRYITQPELLAYFQKVAKRHDLYRNIQFETGVQKAVFDENTGLWTITTDTGEPATARYFVTATGILSATNIPKLNGMERFKGEWYHTSRWPAKVDFTGKRVAVIGTGSTGVQLTTAIAPLVKHLAVFQRTPQYIVPAGNRPLTENEVTAIKEQYDQIWKDARETLLAAGFRESTVPLSSVPEDERDAIFEKAWNNGGGFRFAFETFSDIAVDEGANRAAQEFIRKKIAAIVRDPETARALTPTGLYAKRPLCDSGYYEMFNRDNVSLVDIRKNPIEEVTANGIRTSDGTEHEFDIIVFATGFDGVDGNLKRMDIRGHSKHSIADDWRHGPHTYLGMASNGYPNMFMVTGPNSPFTNVPPVVETQVDWIAELIRNAEARGARVIEARAEAQEDWSRTCWDIAKATLFAKGESWFMGANIPGKAVTSYFYMAGLGPYRSKLEEVRKAGYAGFDFL